MTTTEKKKIAVTMSERAPLKLDPELWPLIASASAHDGQVECQANTLWRLSVREHADGRRVVYGYKTSGNGGQYAGFRDSRGGYLVETGAKVEEETIRAIRRVAGIIGDDGLGDKCIGDLPAQELL